MTKPLFAVLLISTLLLLGYNQVSYIEPVTETAITTEPTETTTPETEETEPPTIETTEETIPETEETEPPTEETTTETYPPIDLDPEDIELLARVIYQEAGGNCYCDDCRRRVADVVLNRIADPRFPNTMLNVLRQEGQYGKYYWTGVVWPDRAWYDSEKPAVERARRIAEEVVSGQHSELYGQNYIWQAEFIQGYDWIYCCGNYFGKG